jgi:hypothetical protein
MFDRSSVQAVRAGARRYNHLTCDPDNKDLVPLEEGKIEDPDLTKLNEYINHLFGSSANWAQIKRQIKIYTTENKYSYSGIMKSLIYFYEVKGNSIDKANGALGIVPFVYKDAFNYYYSLFLAKNQNITKDIPDIISKVKEITIPVPKIIKKKRFFNIDKEDNND